MNKTMKAAVLKEFHRPLVVEEVPIPQPGRGEVLVRVMASGLCLSDVHIQDGVLKTVRVPYTPGHELAGIVAQLGEGVDGVAVGQHVVAWIDIVCHQCALCRRGRENLCLNRVRIGFERDGSHQEYVCVPRESLIPIARHIPFAHAAIVPDAVACMYNALKVQGEIAPGDRVLLAGMGALGIQGVQIAKHFGATVYASGRTDAKLEKALEFGADGAINTTREELHEGMMRLTGGGLCDVIVDLIGTGDSINGQLKCLRPGGKIIAAAYASETFTVDFQEIVIKEKEIIGIRGASPQALGEAIRLVEEGSVVPYVSKRYRLEEINEALEAMRNFQSIGRSVISFEESL